MAIATYTDLQAAVTSWANRLDSTVTGRVPDFISLAEERIFTTGEKPLRVSDMVETSTLIVPAASNSIALPSDWLSFVRVNSSDQPLIQYMSPDDLANLPSPGDAAVYSIEGRNFIYGQTVGVNTTLNIRYYAKPDPLATTPTNWLLSKASGVYLYGALVEFALFIKNPAAAAEWGGLFEKAIRALDSTDRAAMVSGSLLRQRAPAGYGYRTR